MMDGFVDETYFSEVENGDAAGASGLIIKHSLLNWPESTRFLLVL
jgi:hypothetical protein